MVDNHLLYTYHIKKITNVLGGVGIKFSKNFVKNNFNLYL